MHTNINEAISAVPVIGRLKTERRTTSAMMSTIIGNTNTVPAKANTRLAELSIFTFSLKVALLNYNAIGSVYLLL